MPMALIKTKQKTRVFKKPRRILFMRSNAAAQNYQSECLASNSEESGDTPKNLCVNETPTYAECQNTSINIREMKGVKGIVLLLCAACAIAKSKSVSILYNGCKCRSFLSNRCQFSSSSHRIGLRQIWYIPDLYASYLCARLFQLS